MQSATIEQKSFRRPLTLSSRSSNFQRTRLGYRWCSSGCGHTFSGLIQQSLCLELKIDHSITNLTVLLDNKFLGEGVADYKCVYEEEGTGCGREGAGRSARPSKTPDILILNFQKGIPGNNLSCCGCGHSLNITELSSVISNLSLTSHVTLPL